MPAGYGHIRYAAGLAMMELVTIIPIAVLISIVLIGAVLYTVVVPGANTMSNIGVLSLETARLRNSLRSRHFIRGAKVGVALGILSSIGAVAFALHQNPQQSFYGADGIAWFLLGVVGFGWFLVGLIAATPLVAAVSALLDRGSCPAA